MKITKAIITCAGYGTRFLPITKTIQKEMLPILNRPMIDYVVADCVQAGITEIIFVVKENELKLVEHFYSESRSLKQHLKKMGKLSGYTDVAKNYGAVQFKFVTQTIADKYGTAIPLILAEKYVNSEEAFLVFMGDDFIYNPSGTSQASEMIALFQASQADALVTCITKPESELHRYGVAETREKNGYTFLTNLIEKPAVGTAPSNLINISKYIFTPKVFEVLKNQEPDLKSNEYYITDTATTLAQTLPVVIFTPNGQYLDGGSVLNWLKANLIVAKNNPELKDELTSFVQELF